jgi:hypothetical protein
VLSSTRWRTLEIEAASCMLDTGWLGSATSTTSREATVYISDVESGIKKPSRSAPSNISSIEKSPASNLLSLRTTIALDRQSLLDLIKSDTSAVNMLFKNLLVVVASASFAVALPGYSAEPPKTSSGYAAVPPPKTSSAYVPPPVKETTICTPCTSFSTPFHEPKPTIF